MQVLVFLVGLLLFHTICFHLGLQSFDQFDRLEQVDHSSRVSWCYKMLKSLALFKGLPKALPSTWSKRTMKVKTYCECYRYDHICSIGRHATWHPTSASNRRIATLIEPERLSRGAAAIDVISLGTLNKSRKLLLHWQLCFGNISTLYSANLAEHPQQ